MHRRDFLKRAGSVAAMSAAAGGLLDFLEACGSAGSSAGQSAGQTPLKGGRIIEGAAADLTNLNSVIAPGNTNNYQISYLIFDGLLTSRANGDLLPAIAHDMPSVSPDGLTYTFKLRQDVRWTDGRPVTADDVVFTYNLMFDPAYRDVPSPRRGDIETYVQSIDNPDPYTVVIKTKRLFAPFLVTHGQYGIMPRHVLGEMTGKQIATADFNTAPTVSNGQFKFSTWAHGDALTLVRNDTYYGQKAHVDTYVRKVVADPAATVDQLKTGEIDMAPIGGSFLDAVRADPNLQLFVFGNLSIHWFAYNLDPSTNAGKIFADRAVRQALVYAIDRRQIVHAAFFDQGAVAQSWVPPGSWAYNPDTRPAYPFDKKKAMDMLDAAGWKAGPDGIRRKNGVPLAVSWVAYNIEPYHTIAEIIQSMWKDVGVQVDLKITAGATGLQIFEFSHAFDVENISINWQADPDLSLFFSSRNAVAGGLNGMSYKSTELDAMLDQAVSTLDRAKRKDLYARIQDFLATEMPACPLVSPRTLVGATKRVRGAEFSYGGLGVPQHPWVRGAWVADGK